MTYVLGVDLGTTFTAAAVADESGVIPFSLGVGGTAIPSVVFVRDDGSVLVGDAAERRALVEPSRAVREFKRRFGDPTPIVVAGTPFGPEALMARVLQFVLSRVSEERGERPSVIVLSHPATYGDYKLDLMGEVARLAEADSAKLLSEPQAAAIHYASTARVADGELIAVFDFGGGTLDAAVVRKVGDGFELLGEPQGMERFGGIDIDEAVLAHVVESLGSSVSATSSSEPTTRQALMRLRADARTAKEALSSDTETVVPVLLPAVHTEVRLTRAELESMLRPRLGEMTRTLERAVEAAGVTMPEISRVLLVGGSSRIPLIGEAIRAASRRPVAIDANPKHAIALGAATYARELDRRARATQSSQTPIQPPPDGAARAESPKGMAWPRSALGKITTTRSPRSLVAAIAAIALLLAGGAYVVATMGPVDSARASASPGSGSGTLAPSPTAAQFGDFRLPIRAGAIWEFGWDHVATASGSRPTERKGEFRVILGQPSTIEGKTLYAIGVEKISGSDLSIVPTRWTHLGVDGNKLIGSVDGRSVRVVFDAERGTQAGGGFFGEPIAPDKLLSLKSESVSNTYITGPAVTLRQAAQGAQCENFSGVGLVCPGTRESAIRVEYFRAGIGPIAYYSFGSVSTASGGASTTVNIGLLRNDFGAAARPAMTATPTAAPLATLPPRITPIVRVQRTPAPGFARVVDDTGTVSIDVPREWTDQITTPFGDNKVPFILATTDFDGYETFAAPSVNVTVWSGLPPGIPLAGVLEVVIGSGPSGCAAFEAPHLNADGSASALYDCPSARAGVYYLTWTPAGYADRVIILTLRMAGASLSQYSKFYETIDSTVTLYK